MDARGSELPGPPNEKKSRPSPWPRTFPSWGKVFNDDPMIAAAMLDRLLHRSVVMNIDGDSYRMRSHRARAEAARRGQRVPGPTTR
ncbi:MAG TPA: ATP-binding protein [Acidimicrobiales bacterium]|nr:ATP-binding protein [Acidimicrobiales bacterium]